jgi:uncharacterized protein YcfJ
MSRKSKTIIVALACALSIPSAGCSTKAGTGAIVGGVGGALVGGAIGNNRGSHNGASGAAIGAGVGAVGGALVGHGMDKADEKKAKEQREREQYDAQQRPTYSNAAPTTPVATRTPPPPSSQTPSATITRGDIVDWTRQGVKDEIIIDRIQRSGQKFVMTSADEREMKSLGVSANVMLAMKNTTKMSGEAMTR